MAIQFDSMNILLELGLIFWAYYIFQVVSFSQKVSVNDSLMYCKITVKTIFLKMSRFCVLDNCIKVRLPMENKPTLLLLFAFVFFSICALEQMRFFCCYCCSLPNCPDSLSWELNQSKKCDKCNIFRLCSWVPRVQISLLHRLLRSL